MALVAARAIAREAAVDTLGAEGFVYPTRPSIGPTFERGQRPVPVPGRQLRRGSPARSVGLVLDARTSRPRPSRSRRARPTPMRDRLVSQAGSRGAAEVPAGGAT